VKNVNSNPLLVVCCPLSAAKLQKPQTIKRKVGLASKEPERCQKDSGQLSLLWPLTVLLMNRFVLFTFFIH